MDILLGELGYSNHKVGAVIVSLLIACGVVATLLATHLLTLLPSLSPDILQIALWVTWFIWLGWLLPRRRAALLGIDPHGAYRKAFYTDILPGIWLGFAQLGRPLLAALLAAPAAISTMQLVLAAPSILIGTALVIEGHRASGIASTMFIYEYRPLPDVIVSRGIYGRISHPMFLGAVLVSFGVGTLAMGAPFWLGLINLLTLPVYNIVEDRRLGRIYGRAYQTYRRTVGGFIPKVRIPFPSEIV